MENFAINSSKQSHWSTALHKIKYSISYTMPEMNTIKTGVWHHSQTKEDAGGRTMPKVRSLIHLDHLRPRLPSLNVPVLGSVCFGYQRPALMCILWRKTLMALEQLCPVWAESCKGLDVYIASHSPTAGNHWQSIWIVGAGYKSPTLLPRVGKFWCINYSPEFFCGSGDATHVSHNSPEKQN